MNLGTLALLAVALGPAVAIMVYFYAKDKNDREPFGVLLVSFLAGCFSVLPAIILETALPKLVPAVEGPSLLSIAVYTFVIIAASEEFSKYLFLRYYAYRKPSFNEPYDGIIYAAMVGMGFATVENLMYIFGSDSLGAAWATAGLRAVTAVPAHATFAAVMGYFVGLAKFTHHRERTLLFTGFILATVLHGFYDFFLFQNYKEGLMLGALASLIFGIWFTRRSIRLHKQHPEAKKEAPLFPPLKDNTENTGFDAPTKPK